MNINTFQIFGKTKSNTITCFFFFFFFFKSSKRFVFMMKKMNYIIVSPVLCPLKGSLSVYHSLSSACANHHHKSWRHGHWRRALTISYGKSIFILISDWVSTIDFLKHIIGEGNPWYDSPNLLGEQVRRVLCLPPCGRTMLHIEWSLQVCK